MSFQLSSSPLGAWLHEAGCDGWRSDMLVDARRPRSEDPPVASTLALLRQRQAETKEAVRALVEREGDAFEQQQARAERLSRALPELLHQCAAIAGQSAEQTTQIQTAWARHRKLVQRAEDQSCLHTMLSDLLMAHDTLECIDSVVKQQQWAAALREWKVLHSPRLAWLAETDYWRRLVRWNEDLRTSIWTQTDSIIEQSILLSDGRLVLPPTKSTQEVDQGTVNELAEALRLQGRLASHENRVQEHCMQQIFLPYFRSLTCCNGSATEVQAAFVPLSIQTSESALWLSQDRETAPYASVSTALQFLRARWTHSLIPTLQPLLYEEVLNSLQRQLPADLAALSEFQVVLEAALVLEQQVFYPDTKIQAWSQSLANHWVAKVNADSFARCRTVVQSDARAWEASILPIRTRILPLPQAIAASAPPKPRQDISLSATPSADLPPTASTSYDTGSSALQQSVPLSSTPRDIIPVKTKSKLGAVRKIATQPSKLQSSSTVATSIPPPPRPPEDEWGFDDDGLDLEAASDMAAPGESQAEAAWGFDDPISPKVERQVPLAVEEDGWGFNEDAEDASEDDGWGDAFSSHPSSRIASVTSIPSVAASVPLSPPALSVPPYHEPPQAVHQAPPPNQWKVEPCAVSQHAQMLMALVSDVLLIISSAQQSSSPMLSTSQQPISQLLAPSVFSLFDYYRATMLVQHARLLNTVPTLGMQFANDCEWLAMQLEQLGPSLPTVLQSQELQRTIGAVTSFADVHRRKQMIIQIQTLQEVYDSLGGFNDVTHPTAYAQAERGVRQLRDGLQRLAQCWKPPVMPHLTFLSMMGRLITHILQCCISDITAHQDLGEDESRAITMLCQPLQSLDQIFDQNDQSMVGIYVPNWFKFAFLIEILEGSMVDIMFLFDEGNLVDFSTVELVHLIRSLFADSPTRQQNIDRIRSAMQ